MIPKEEELIKFIKSKNLVNFSSIARHFKIKNTTVSDLIQDLEHNNLVEVQALGGSKIVRVRENKNKKAQVTVYAILGILIVVAVATVFLINNYIIKSQFEREAEKIQVVDEFKPVKDYLDSCIKEIALQGAELMGLQGGYINIPEDNLPVNPAIPFSNRLDIFGNNALQVPYWFYETANGIQTQQIPTIEEMQNQLASYVNLNVDTCLNNFTAFEGYEISNFENLNTNVEIRDEKIFVTLLSNIIINYKDIEVNFDKFLVSVDSPLGKLYNLGKEIFEKENTETFFEQKTIDMLILYDEVPYSGTSFSCSPRAWFTENIRKDLKTILRANIEAVNPANEGYFKYDISTGNTLVDFKYDEQWPFILKVNGGEEVLKEESAFGQSGPAAAFLSTLFCLNNYHFVYDIKYPILVSLNDGEHFFQYAIQVIIKNNQPRENKLGEEYLGDITSRVCNTPSVRTLINVRDANTGNSIENAKVEFSCVGTTCDLGNTGKQGLSTLVPACVNAVISANKEGYHQNKIILDTLDESLVDLELKQYQKKQIEIKLIDGNKIRDARQDEFVTFNLVNEDENYNLFINNEITEINLLPGRYHIQSFIVKDYPSGLKLNKQTIEYCTDIPKSGVLGLIGITEKKCFNTELEETQLEKVIVGGAEFDWEITQDDLNKAQKLTLYTIYNKVPSNIQELTQTYEQILKNSDSTNFRKPLLK
ncbi:MAG: hypothetical protein AABW45_02170 [Nanoarchaeota archaeon]